MISLLAALALSRDAYGVPHIQAKSVSEAWFQCGYAVAQDRLWQMEMSRRVAEGRMSEVFGEKYVKSDTEILKVGYTPSEIHQQYLNLDASARAALDAYARGVNAWVAEASRAGSLPPGYADTGFSPRAWTVDDSVAILISLMQRFGKGASGQLRNLAALSYLAGQPALKTRELVLDAFDDLAWYNDPAAPTTVLPEDDKGSADGIFFQPSRADTEKQLAALPSFSFLELLPAIQAVEEPEATLVAEQLGAPFKVGSYAMVVSPKRSSSGRALLLSGPQMGFSNPSVVHEISVSAPGLRVTGMDVPGVPGVLVGATPSFAWGLTSGVADTDDVYYYPASIRGTAGYRRIDQKLPVKGEADRVVQQYRTDDGPVIFSNSKGVFARRSAYWMRETKAYEAVFHLYGARTPDQIEAAIRPAPMSFNFFYATTSGHTGYVYVGDVPMRSRGLDPRLPTPASPENRWKGMIPKSRMPQVRDPKGGLLTNWNNKPAAWWPNQDTPVWGAIDHVQVIRANLPLQKLDPEWLGYVASRIATRDPNWAAFAPHFVTSRLKEDSDLVSYVGETTSPESPAFNAFLDQLRTTLVVPKLGAFVSPDYLRLVVQPSLILRALRGQTKIDYLGGRSDLQVIEGAARRVDPMKLTPVKDQIDVPGEKPILHRNRGTFIQIVELSTPPSVRTILPPGEAEAGPHRTDQAKLARGFEFKKMPW